MAGQGQDDDGFQTVTSRGNRGNRNQGSRQGVGAAGGQGQGQTQGGGGGHQRPGRDGGGRDGGGRGGGGRGGGGRVGVEWVAGDWGGGGRDGGGRDGRGQGGGGQGGGGQGGGGRSGGGRPQVNDSQIYLPGKTVPPSTKVSDIENEIPQGAKLAGLKLSDTYPVRPAYGTAGKPVILWANYVEMIPPSNLVLYRYSIAIHQAATGKKREQIIRLFLEKPRLAKINRDLVTDFKENLISCRPLPPIEYQFPYRAEKEDEPRGDADVYTVGIKPNGSLTVADLMDYLTSSNVGQGFDDKLPMIQALNILIRHYAKSNENLAAVGSSKTYALQRNWQYNLQGGLIALRGFFSSVRVATARILVNVNVSHGAFYAPGSLTGLMEPYLDDLHQLRSFVRKVRVQVTHLPKRTNKASEVIPNEKTIVGLASMMDGRGGAHPPRVSYDGAQPMHVQFAQETPAGVNYITVSEYFSQKYGEDLRKSKYPVVNLGTSAQPRYYPAEVCEVVDGQPYRKVLEGSQTADMIRVAARRPRENALSIVNEGLGTVGLVGSDNPILERFGITVRPNLITVPARILDTPTIAYKPPTIIRTDSGAWNLAKCKCSVAETLPSWTVLAISKKGFGSATLRSDVEKRARYFHAHLTTMGIRAPQPPTVEILQTIGHHDPAIERRIREIAKTPRFLVIVLPGKEADRYRHIKRIGDIEVGIPTVCVQAAKFLPKDDPQYCANVALKVNLKLGGTNQLVGPHPIISEDKTMIVGIDVTHPSPGSAENAPSVAGMVANVDKQLGQWPAALYAQKGRQEKVEHLTLMLKSRLQLWMKHHRGSCPENILVYRDGVSEGQYEIVIREELPQLRKACRETYPATQTEQNLPRFTIVIVGKRHHTRFYPTNGNDAEKSTNTRPGTVVDRGITEMRNWDFFLQAHSAIHGTVRPAHYFVVLDEIFKRRDARTAADDLERLTHELCYAYGRASRAVKVCMPTYYADLVCDRARHYLSQLYNAAGNVGAGAAAVPPGPVYVHSNLRDTMFYI